MPKHKDIDWKSLLEGTNPIYRRGRALFRRLPHEPRCKVCAAPFEGPGAPLMRMIGRGRWAKNPNYCNICLHFVEGQRGGAEVEVSLLFADVRGSTALAERLPPADFSALMNRFYEIASQVVIEHEGIVDKFVGDEVVAFFVPAFAGRGHPARAIDAARALLVATGAESTEGPWIPVGAGVHTGLTYIGAVGGEDTMVDFTALGDNVNMTARLASAAAAGEVLVTRAAAEAAGLAGQFEQRNLALRGRSEPVDVVVLRVGGVPAPA